MTNPFVAKAKAKKETNPFSVKAKKGSATSNPFTQRTKSRKADRIAELELMIKQAEERYEESLTKAVKGMTKAQVDKLFNASDRYMQTLLNLSSQHRRLTNDDGK